MSRAAPTKGRGSEKTRPPASLTPVIAHEIVPGKFNDNDWNNMLDRDGSEDFITDIVDELMDNTMDVIYKKYIERQLLPFTITQARDAIIEIIEWQFLARDEGEKSVEADAGWAQDEEPEPAVTDCWAQGSMPKNYIEPPIEPLEEITEEPEAEEAVAEVPPVEEAPQEPAELPDYVSDTEEAPQVSEAGETKEEDVATKGAKDSSVKIKTSKKFRPYRGKIKSAGVSKMTESLEETEMKMIYDEIAASMPPSEDKPSTLFNMPASCSSILKVQTGRPPGTKDVMYDDFGNVIAVMKLDAEKLPSHKINVKYHVVDPAVEAAQARLDAMRKGKSTGSKLKKTRSSKALSSTMESVATGTRSKPSIPTSTVAPLPPPLVSSVGSLTQSSTDIPPPRPPPMIEEMEVSHGVIVREGGRVKKGPGRYYRKLDILDDNQKGMQPVSLRVTNPGITVSDLLDRHTPILRPLGESSPLPPIVPQPPQQTQQATY